MLFYTRMQSYFIFSIHDGILRSTLPWSEGIYQAIQIILLMKVVKRVLKNLFSIS